MSAESVLYLASASPRRRELLQQLGFEPQRIVAPIDETRLAAQQVIDLFLDEESHSLAMLADFVGKPVTLQVEAEYNQEQFDVVLL